MLISSKKNRNEAKNNTSHTPFIPSTPMVDKVGGIYGSPAETVARKMEMHASALHKNAFFKPTPITIQRKCAACEEEKNAQRKEIGSAKENDVEGIENFVSNLDGRGTALSDDVRNFFEPRMGYDFSNVKVHTDTTAAQSAQSMNAAAYTSGTDIVFNHGQYAPHTEGGKRLLSHELAHVIQQQNRTSPKRVQRLVTDEALGARSEMASVPIRVCGSTVGDCYGRCRAADGTIGSCHWGGLTYGCRCRSHRGDEPAPAARRVPFWVYALGGAAAALIAACFLSGVCEAGAIIAAVGEASAAVIMALLRAAGILIAT